MRRVLPRMVRAEVQAIVCKEIQPFEESLAGRVVGIVRNCQDRAFRAYREGSDAEEDMRLPPSVVPDGPTFQEQEEANMQEEESSKHLNSQFIDAVFTHPPSIQDEDHFLDFQARNELLPCPAHNSFSDSGYASEMWCNCPGPCSCTATSFSSSSDFCHSHGMHDSEEMPHLEFWSDRSLLAAAEESGDSYSF